MTSAGEGLRRGLGVSVVPSRLTHFLPTSSSSSAVSVPPAAASAMPLSLVPILAVVDVAGSAIVPAVAPLLVQRSRDFQDGGGETIDLSTKGRRCRPKDADDDEAVPLIKVPRVKPVSDDDHQSIPLNLSIPRDTPRDTASRDSSSYRVIGEWDVADNNSTTTDTTAADDVSATSEASSSQILLLSGKQYEIVPLGDGRWISRNEYELQRGLQKSSSGVEQGVGTAARAGTDGSGEKSEQIASTGSAAEAGKDEEPTKKAISPDEVSSTIESCREDEFNGSQLQIAEDVTSDREDENDVNTESVKLPASHSLDTDTTIAMTVADGDEQSVEVISSI